MKTLLIMAGGTGGHVIPALAVAGELRARGVNIVWMGTQAGIEARLVPAAGYELKLVDVKGLRGNGLMRKLVAPFVLLRAAMQSMSIILSVKASAVLGMGGYVSGPGGVMAKLLRRPLVLHEQNAIAGTTNRLLAPYANRIMTGFKHVASLEKGRHIGNPVRAEIVAIAEPAERMQLHKNSLDVLVVGGSQGAQVFNETLPALFARLQQGLGEIKLNIVHQCGRDNQLQTEQTYAQQEQAASVQAFIEDMAEAYQQADLVICRAGAMTVAEVAAAGVAALFVPLPYAIDDHQFHNARALADDQAALCLRQEQFVNGEWIETVQGLAESRSGLIEMAQRARANARPDATQIAADICMEVMDA